MSIAENIKLDENFMAGWNNHSVEQTLSCLSDQAVWTDVGSPKPMTDKGEIGQYVQSWFTAFPDMQATVKNRVVSEDGLAVEVEFTGTNGGPLQMSSEMPALPATGKKVIGKGTYFVRIENGKAVEVHTYPDVAGLMMQLGLMQS